MKRSDDISLTAGNSSFAGMSAVILAGGKSTRFGGVAKESILIEGQPILYRALSVLNGIFSEIIIVSNLPGNLGKSTDHAVITDQIEEAGPLGGIHAGLLKARNEGVFVFAGDMPFLDAALIREQIDFASRNHAKAVIPDLDGAIEPLHGIYMKSLADRIAEFITSGKSPSIRKLLSQIDVAWFRPGSPETAKRAFANINSPGDLLKYE